MANEIADAIQHTILVISNGRDSPCVDAYQMHISVINVHNIKHDGTGTHTVYS